MGSIRGTVVGPTAEATVRLVRADGTGESVDTKTNRTGAFEFPDVSPGWYILSGVAPGFLETIEPVRVEGDASADSRPLTLLLELQARQAPVPILTVCEALERRGSINHAAVVIVGIFKSGMDETLRLDCPFQLVTGEVGWPNSIGLTRPSQPPYELRDQVERKRAEVLKSGPPGAQPRPERVVGLYGVFVAPAGLTSAPCCNAAVETTIPPARLLGIGEKDLRVIR